MKKLLTCTLTTCLLFCIAGCNSNKTTEVDGPYDHYVGWYELSNKTLIPVMKREGAFYSACRGFEVPLLESPGGLQWTMASSMAGTTIGRHPGSNQYYIVIKDRMMASVQEETQESIRKSGFKLGDRTSMARVGKPSGLLNTKTKRPRTNDDFVGYYLPALFPYVRIEIRKEGQKYTTTTQEFDESSVWKTPGKPTEMTPLVDRLGLTVDKNSNLVYNESLKRFEIMMETAKEASSVIRMPLARVSASSKSGTADKPIVIGIPSWH